MTNELSPHSSLSSADFFSKSTFSENSFRNIIRVSNVWIQVRPDILLGLIWVQTVCKGYQQTTVVSDKEGAQWLSGRVLGSRPRGPGFESHQRHCVVSLNKNINSSLRSTGSTQEDLAVPL